MIDTLRRDVALCRGNVKHLSSKRNIGAVLELAGERRETRATQKVKAFHFEHRSFQKRTERFELVAQRRHTPDTWHLHDRP